MKKQVYKPENDAITKIRIKMAQIWHGPTRKTLVYSVPFAWISFPQKEKVNIPNV